MPTTSCCQITRQKLSLRHGQKVKLAFESTYLSADAVVRSVEEIITMAMSETDSVTSFTNKHRDNFSNFRRQAERTGVSELEALKIGIFERGLTPELYERQRLGPYCRTMQESSDRAQRSAGTLE